jgi:hypothetical protein
VFAIVIEAAFSISLLPTRLPVSAEPHLQSVGGRGGP